jgi:predicted metal-dependent enzyme (double-stranded beta helix superfamily)
VLDLDEFISDCVAANSEDRPSLAVRDVLTRLLEHSDAVLTALAPAEGGLELLYRSPALSIVHAVWAPRMQLVPHDHRMWAVIGIYGGTEENAFFRRSGEAADPLVGSGGKVIDTGDVLVLGDDVIHSVANPTDRLTGAIHVYGGDFVDQPRSQWVPGEAGERPFAMAEAQRHFAEANAAWRASTLSSDGPPLEA